MTPSIDLRIATMLRAMQEVVSPAIDGNNSLAREQAALVIGQLKLLAEQWNKAEDYAQACLADLVQSVEGLQAQGGEHTQQASAGLIAAIADNADWSAEQHFKAVMAGADALVRAADLDGEAAFRTALRKALLAFSKRQSLRDRSWFQLSGFDLKPDELHTVDDIIKGHAS